MIENFTNNKPVKEVTYLNTENSQRYRTETWAFNEL